MYITSYIDGNKSVDTLDGFSDDTLNYFKEIFEKYSALSGYDGFSEDTSNGSFWADLDISLTSKDSDSFDAILLSSYWIDGVNDNQSVYDLYSLTFELNEENKFNLTEKTFYEDFEGYVSYYDGTYAFFNFYSDEDVKSLNIETGNYKTESVLTTNFNFYLGDENDVNLSEYQQTNNYGLIAGFNDPEEKLIIVQNIEKENHSVLFEIEHDENKNTYIDDITENKNKTINVVAGKSLWSYSDDYSIQEAKESYELYTYNIDGTLNEIDLGTYDTYYKYEITDNYWEILERSYTSFFLWNDDDNDTWLVKEYQYENHISNDGFDYYEGYVLDDDFNINNEADLTLRLEEDLDFENYVNINSRADNQGFTFGFIFSETQAQHEYILDKNDRITKKIDEANSWGEINYKTYDWSEVDYDSLSEYETERIKWKKVDLKLALDSEDFRFDAIDWEEIKKKGGVNTKKAYKLLNNYNFDDDEDTINLKYLTSVKKIKAGGGNDSIEGNSKKNSFYGQDGNDTIKGYSGSDKLYGGDDNDKLYGDSSADKLYGQDGDDYLEGGSSKDTLYGGNGNDELYGGTDKDFLRGGEDEDTLYGESGNDKLKGEDGDDILVGGLGKDNLYGGAGNDVFKLTEGSGYDRIRDFKKGEDRIDIADFDINELGVFDSGKNIKVYLDKDKSDLLAIIYKNNIDVGLISEFIF